MRRHGNVTVCLIIAAVLVSWGLCGGADSARAENPRHVIVGFDVSKNMAGGKRSSKSDDSKKIERLKQYVIQTLYDSAPAIVSSGDKVAFRDDDPALKGPLYRQGDFLTYFQFGDSAEFIYTRKSDFTPQSSFAGEMPGAFRSKTSSAPCAKAKAFELHNPDDSSTYFVIVSEPDEDRKSRDKGKPQDCELRDAAYEAELNRKKVYSLEVDQKPVLEIYRIDGKVPASLFTLTAPDKNRTDTLEFVPEGTDATLKPGYAVAPLPKLDKGYRISGLRLLISPLDKDKAEKEINIPVKGDGSVPLGELRIPQSLVTDAYKAELRIEYGGDTGRKRRRGGSADQEKTIGKIALKLDATAVKAAEPVPEPKPAAPAKKQRTTYSKRDAKPTRTQAAPAGETLTPRTEADAVKPVPNPFRLASNSVSLIRADDRIELEIQVTLREGAPQGVFQVTDAVWTDATEAHRLALTADTKEPPTRLKATAPAELASKAASSGGMLLGILQVTFTQSGVAAPQTQSLPLALVDVPFSPAERPPRTSAAPGTAAGPEAVSASPGAGSGAESARPIPRLSLQCPGRTGELVFSRSGDGLAFDCMVMSSEPWPADLRIMEASLKTGSKTYPLGAFATGDIGRPFRGELTKAHWAELAKLSESGGTLEFRYSRSSGPAEYAVIPVSIRAPELPAEAPADPFIVVIDPKQNVPIGSLNARAGEQGILTPDFFVKFRDSIPPEVQEKALDVQYRITGLFEREGAVARFPFQIKSGTGNLGSTPSAKPALNLTIEYGFQGATTRAKQVITLNVEAAAAPPVKFEVISRANKTPLKEMKLEKLDESFVGKEAQLVLKLGEVEKIPTVRLVLRIPGGARTGGQAPALAEWRNVDVKRPFPIDVNIQAAKLESLRPAKESSIGDLFDTDPEIITLDTSLEVNFVQLGGGAPAQALLPVKLRIEVPKFPWLYVLSAALLFILLIVALIVSKLLRGRNASVRFKIAALVPDPNTGQGEELISESFELRPGGQLRLSSDPMWTNAWGAPELPTKYISCWKTSAFGGRQLILADSDGPASIPLNDLQEVEASRPDGSSVKLRIMIMPPAVSSKKG